MIERSWADLKADALEAYQFRLASDPRLTWHIETDKIEPSDFVGIVQYYNFASEKLKCSICDRAVHNAGAVIQVSDHTFRLVGCCCGKKHFSSDWTKQTSAFHKAERHALRRKRAKLILLRWDDIHNYLSSLRRPFQILEDARRSIKGALGNDFGLLCKDLSEHHGVLTYTRRLGSKLLNQGGRSSMTSVREEIGLVDGWTIYSHFDFRKRLENSISDMHTSLNHLRTAIDKNIDPSKGLRLFYETKEMLETLQREISFASRYGDISNFHHINEWLGHNGSSKKLVVHDGTIMVKQPGWPDRSIEIFSFSAPSYNEALFDIDAH